MGRWLVSTLNPGMLSVARSQNPRIEWKEGSAEPIPFPDQSRVLAIYFPSSAEPDRSIWVRRGPDQDRNFELCLSATQRVRLAIHLQHSARERS